MLKTLVPMNAIIANAITNPARDDLNSGTGLARVISHQS
jgi:hypothetical protein